MSQSQRANLTKFKVLSLSRRAILVWTARGAGKIMYGHQRRIIKIINNIASSKKTYLVLLMHVTY